jgi:hypothetical protein
VAVRSVGGEVSATRGVLLCIVNDSALGRG